MYICTRVNLQDMYFEHVNAQNKILRAYVVQLCIFRPFLSYIITHDRTCFKHERLSVFV
jgi:hypothetical protein